MSKLLVANVRWCMRGAPGQGIWYEGMASLCEPTSIPNYHHPVDTVNCGCRHIDPVTAKACVKNAAKAALAALTAPSVPAEPTQGAFFDLADLTTGAAA